MWWLGEALALGYLGVALVPAPALAQPAPSSPAGAAGQPADASQQAVGPIMLPAITVTAQKEPVEAQTLPVSLTVLPRQALADAGVSVLRDVAAYAPNTYFSAFTARKLSNARFRGIGSSPANPAITTYLDGVPQLNENSSSVELLDVDQVEFVRGPQSALFGRNALGGVITVTSVPPSLGAWTGALTVPLASHGARDLQGTVSGPLVTGRLGLAVSLGYGRRDGYTENVLTGNDLDHRSAFASKAQILWTPTNEWLVRVIVSGERARDGDYTLSDLGGLRVSPFRTSRDFEGHTDRDIVNTTVTTRREGARLALSTTTGFVRWTTEDLTDLDYTPLPLVTRTNAEESFQFTQEVRLASAAGAPARLGDAVTLRWQAGVFVFTQHYDQDAVNDFSPFVLSPFLGFPVTQHAPQSSLDDRGLGVFGQGTFTLAEVVDVTAGARVDHERREATLNTFFEPVIAPGQQVRAEKSFSNVSPQFAAVVRLQPDKSVYVSLARGFKAGGFNAASPAGSEAYDEERTWNVEGGVKTTWAAGRVTANVAVFRIDWDDLQLNLPDPLVPAQFYIANVGGATSTGVELEVTARVREGVDVFSALGYNRATFNEGSISSGAAVGGNRIPNAPEYMATVGTQLSREIRPGTTVYGRAEATVYGAYEYDDLNREAQDAYSLANLRIGVRVGNLFTEAWVRNAFDTRYVPVAFAYDGFAPSGFVGESGPPRTFGIRSGVTF